MSSPKYTTRMSIRELDTPKHKKTRDRFLLAWKLFKERDDTCKKSFHSIAEYHGMPFDKGDVGPEGWGGYCQHGNVLFPVWHRYYCHELEQGLKDAMLEYMRKCKGTENASEEDVCDIALHYWDESVPIDEDDTEDEKIEKLVPKLLTDEKVTITYPGTDGQEVTEEIMNPLTHFQVKAGISGNADSWYLKPKNYQTVRFPFSGIKNPPNQKDIADDHNDSISDLDHTETLQKNLVHTIADVGRHEADDTVIQLFKNCLDDDAQMYNKFSNTNSNPHNSMEQPHNDVHVACGGYTKFTIDKNGHLDYGDKSGILDGANGDMGANEVASFDPIFFLHHANIDRMFWVWQKKWHKTGREGDEKFIITNDDKGSIVNGGNSGQGPTPGQNMGDPLKMDSELRPFKDTEDNFQTANGCVDIEGQLGYTYTIGSLDQDDWPRLPKRKYEDIGEPESNAPAAPGLPTVRKTTGEHLKSKMKSLKEKIKKKKSGPSAAPKPSTGGGGTPIEIMYEMNHKITSLGKESEEKQEGWPEEFKMVNDSFEIDGTKFKREFYTKVEGIDMNQFYGSFIVITGRRIYDEQSNKYVWTIIHQKAVLARWDKSACKNCQNHSSVDLCFSMGKVLPGDLLKNNWNVWFVFRRMDNHRFAIFPVVPYSDGNGERVPENSYREINHFVRICEMPSKN